MAGGSVGKGLEMVGVSGQKLHSYQRPKYHVASDLNQQ